MKYFNKLVRDFIPDVIRANGDIPKTRVLRSAEYKKKLLEKLNEEVQELTESNSKQAFIEEFADVVEVLHALKNAYGVDQKDINTVRRKKKKERGAFEKKVFLISTN